MFLSAVIPLTALNTPESQTHPFLGREAHALFYGLVSRADANLANALHDTRGEKPFTVSALAARMRAANDIRAGQQYEWRITAFEGQLARALCEQVLPQLPREVRLGPARFEVGTPLMESTQHRWAGKLEPSELLTRWFYTQRRLEKRITLEFASPTAYRQIHRNVLVPNPAGVFASYLAAWNAFCAPRFEKDLAAQVEQHVAITRYQLRTETVDFGEYRELGWLGACSYTIFSEELALRRILHLLADFAFYCGTGYKTTQGMGQTRKVE